MEHNRAFQEMFQAAKGMLEGKDPVEIARNAEVEFDGTAFLVPSLGENYHVSYPDYLCEEPLEEWQYLVILHYLNLADGTSVTGETCAMEEVPGGLVRGSKYAQTAAKTLTEFLEGKTQEQVKDMLAALGGEEIAGKADFCVKLPFLPRFPLYLNIWFADEEFPPSARMLVDRSAEHYLTIEDVVTVGEVVLERLKKSMLK